jgi:hypothetical protein
MKQYRINSPALRLTFFIMGLIVSSGIALTGIANVHWLLFVPTVFLIFAGITGICPSLIISKWLFKEP